MARDFSNGFVFERGWIPRSGKVVRRGRVRTALQPWTKGWIPECDWCDRPSRDGESTCGRQQCRDLDRSYSEYMAGQGRQYSSPALDRHMAEQREALADSLDWLDTNGFDL